MVLSYVRSWCSPRGEVWQLNELSVFFLPKHFCHSDPSLSPKQRPPLRLPGPAQKTRKVLSSRSAQVDCTAKQSTPHSPEPSALNVAGEEGGSWEKLLFVRITHHGEMWVGCSWGKRETSLLLKPGVEQPIPKSCQLLRTQKTTSHANKNRGSSEFPPSINTEPKVDITLKEAGKGIFRWPTQRWNGLYDLFQLRFLENEIKQGSNPHREKDNGMGQRQRGQPGGVSSHDLQEPIAKHLGNLRPDGYIISSLKSDTVRISTQ